MNKIVNYVTTYFVWVADLILTLWLAYLCKTSLLSIFALFYTRYNLAYANAVNFIDKAFTILLGLGWLVFMLVVEHYFRTNIDNVGQPQRLANVTGWVLVCVFSVDLLFAWIQGPGGGNWLRWLVLAVELGVGVALLVSAKTRLISKSN